MSLGYPIPGLPGVRAATRTSYRRVFFQGAIYDSLAGGKSVDGAKARDPGNTGTINVLRAGLLLGKITATGLYAPCVIGTLAGAVSATGVTVTVSAASATELVRRVGATGTLRLVGPPTAAGVVATFTETYSAVNTTTGAITVSALNADLVAGSFVCADDGSYLPITFVDDGYGLLVTDNDGDDVTAQLPRVPIAGVVELSALLPTPSDASLKAWIISNLNASAGGQFVFADFRY